MIGFISDSFQLQRGRAFMLLVGQQVFDRAAAATPLSRMMRTTSVCCVDISPTMRSLRSSEPSRTAVSGVFSSCDTWRRKRL